jgi:hypothetical protein
MGNWTTMLNVKAVVNGRLVMVRTQMRCYYEYYIFPTDKVDYSNGEKGIIKSGFKFTNWKAALEAGKKAVKSDSGNNEK